MSTIISAFMMLRYVNSLTRMSYTKRGLRGVGNAPGARNFIVREPLTHWFRCKTKIEKPAVLFGRTRGTGI